jgi:hypothetical protein
MRVRIPEWSGRSSVTVNGEAVPDVKTGEYARIERAWRAGDELRLELDVGARVVRALGLGDRYVAVMRGPVVMARDSRLGGGDVDDVASLSADAGGYIALQPATARSESVWMAFTAQFDQALHDAKGELVSIDYSSVGDGWDEKSRFRVRMPQMLDPSRSGPA